MSITFICRLTALILSFSQLDYAFASGALGEDLSPAVRRAQHLGQEIHNTANTSEAQVKVASLRKRIGNASGPHTLNREEKKAVIKAIAQTETAMMLIDGNYNFHFMPDYISSTACSLAQQIHRATVFAIARASQILVENRNATNTDIATLIRRNLNSRYMPAWMREAYNRSKMLKAFDYRAELYEHTSLENLPLANKRLEERGTEQRNGSRPKFTITLTEEHKEEIKIGHTEKGLPFAEDAFPLDRHEFEAFAINPDGACFFYGCQGPHGYFNRKDFGEQIVDNLDTDALLEEYTHSTIIELFMKYSHLGVLDCFLSDLPQLEKLEFIAGSDEILNDPVRHKAAMEHHRNTVVKDAFRKVLTKEKIKKIITYHTNLNIKTGFSAELTYVDLIAYLNNLSICEFSFTKNQVGIFKLPKSAQSDTIYVRGPSYFHVASPTARQTFLVSDGDHVTRLVPTENTLDNLIEWIKAKAHEENRETKINTGYKKSWMKGARFSA